MSEVTTSQPHAMNRSGAIIGGIFLIGLGVVFLLSNFGMIYIDNWWALFILIGTAGAWGNAWHLYRSNGQRITPPVTGAFVGGLFPLAVALIFLFDLSWDKMWPIFLILAGLAVLSRYFAASN